MADVEQTRRQTRRQTLILYLFLCPLCLHILTKKDQIYIPAKGSQHLLYTRLMDTGRVTMPLSKHGYTKAFDHFLGLAHLTVILLLTVDVETNPGPSPMGISSLNNLHLAPQPLPSPTTSTSHNTTAASLDSTAANLAVTAATPTASPGSTTASCALSAAAISANLASTVAGWASAAAILDPIAAIWTVVPSGPSSLTANSSVAGCPLHHVAPG
ncbi:hypothetical protein ABVT39_022182 [Epinephelus coioides]